MNFTRNVTVHSAGCGVAFSKFESVSLYYLFLSTSGNFVGHGYPYSTANFKAMEDLSSSMCSVDASNHPSKSRRHGMSAYILSVRLFDLVKQIEEFI